MLFMKRLLFMQPVERQMQLLKSYLCIIRLKLDVTHQLARNHGIRDADKGHLGQSGDEAVSTSRQLLRLPRTLAPTLLKQSCLAPAPG
jgi:hypothetical protein